MQVPDSATADAEFLAAVTDAIGGLPGVLAVALGGSRAQETHSPSSDWDFSLYYRGFFDPDDLRALDWGGDVSDIGGWGGGVFNGGGWFSLDGRRVDVHYRDLDVVDRVLADAEHGRFDIEHLLFHQAGIPTYLLAAELALNRVLRGELPRPSYPDALRRSAPPVWSERADLTLRYARSAHAEHGRVAQCAGLLSEAACQAAHAVLALRGEWITNEKQLLTRAGLRGIDDIVAGMSPDPVILTGAADRARGLIDSTLGRARRTPPPAGMPSE
jgi:hypothetical protein